VKSPSNSEIDLAVRAARANRNRERRLQFDQLDLAVRAARANRNGQVYLITDENDLAVRAARANRNMNGLVRAFDMI